MLRVLKSKLIQGGSAESRVSFEADLGAVSIGSRFLLLDGRRTYDLGINCQTCATLFTRLPGATKSLDIKEAAEALRCSLDSLDHDVVTKLSLGLPLGEYVGVLADAPLLLVQPGDVNDYFCKEEVDLWGEEKFYCLPHNPRVAYYRAGDIDIGNGRRLFNFIIPMYPTKWLTFTTVAKYREEMEANGTGTAVAISILDVKGPTTWVGEQDPDPVEHWCFTHYLLDGHHKLHAAHEAGRSLRLLSFIALAQGVAERPQVDEALGVLASLYEVP